MDTMKTLKKRLLIFLAIAGIFGIAWAAYTGNPYEAGLTTGTEVSSTYEGRHITILESELIHPSHTDGFVDKGDQICFDDGDSSPTLVGVSFLSASAATDYVSIDTEGIWNLTMTNTALMYIGDPVYIDSDNNAALSNTATGIAFGWLLVDVATSNTAVVVPIKVHGDVDVD
ncbi:DUF2190 family protein [Candidatus Pacearchaeota archaeon]|nr:DUF2190 family protein [Candidatus Pacearchaeota archaeon]